MDVKLVMFKPSGERKDLPVVNPVTVLGRGDECDLRVPLKSVSRRHCELTLSEDELKVKDLGSSNGTYVNNKRINEGSVKAGDRLVVGPVVFTVQIDNVPEEIQPVKTKGQLMAEAGEPGAEEIIDLEADVLTKAEGDALEKIGDPDSGQQDQSQALDDLVGSAGGEEGEIDPISALEALAAESEKKDDEEEKQK